MSGCANISSQRSGRSASTVNALTTRKSATTAVSHLENRYMCYVNILFQSHGRNASTASASRRSATTAVSSFPGSNVNTALTSYLRALGEVRARQVRTEGVPPLQWVAFKSQSPYYTDVFALEPWEECKYGKCVDKPDDCHGKCSEFCRREVMSIPLISTSEYWEKCHNGKCIGHK
jgi:hypothetical protein